MIIKPNTSCEVRTKQKTPMQQFQCLKFGLSFSNFTSKCFTVKRKSRIKCQLLEIKFISMLTFIQIKKANFMSCLFLGLDQIRDSL